MFDTLMQYGGHRVTYLNDCARGKACALGFYVRGELVKGQRYSHSTKHHLMAGLDVIQESLGRENLVAVYLDVDVLDNLSRPAYLQMKQDLCAGMFHRLFVFSQSDLMGNHQVDQDVYDLYRQTGGFDLLSADPYAWTPGYLTLGSLGFMASERISLCPTL